MQNEIHVLVVDDDRLNAVALRRVLELEGIVATTVTSAEAALCQLAEKPYHTILTDLHLPHVSGQELARRLRHTQLIALSGDTRGLDRALFFDVKFRKPCDPDRLINAILEVHRTGPRRTP